jgi:uncharacterized protein (TIGR02588 family)
MTTTNRRNHRHTEAGKPTLVEWLTGIISGLLVVALMAWIAREALMKEERRPELSVQVLETTKTGQFFQVEFELINKAQSTAAAVKVVGELILPTSREVSDVTFDYAPAESSTRGALIFRADPAMGRLDIRPSGYTEP